jgi:hypothetical protein
LLCQVPDFDIGRLVAVLAQELGMIDFALFWSQTESSMRRRHLSISRMPIFQFYLTNFQSFTKRDLCEPEFHTIVGFFSEF